MGGQAGEGDQAAAAGRAGAGSGVTAPAPAAAAHAAAPLRAGARPVTAEDGAAVAGAAADSGDDPKPPVEVGAERPPVDGRPAAGAGTSGRPSGSLATSAT